MHALGSETPTFDVYLPLKLPHLELATARVRPCEVTGVRVAARWRPRWTLVVALVVVRDS